MINCKELGCVNYQILIFKRCMGRSEIKTLKESWLLKVGSLVIYSARGVVEV